MTELQCNEGAPCERGRALIEWSERRMPALGLLRRDFAERRPLEGIRIGGSLHLTP
jgi:adenosylhomocysteinase